MSAGLGQEEAETKVAIVPQSQRPWRGILKNHFEKPAGPAGPIVLPTVASRPGKLDGPQALPTGYRATAKTALLVQERVNRHRVWQAATGNFLTQTGSQESDRCSFRAPASRIALGSPCF